MPMEESFDSSEPQTPIGQNNRVLLILEDFDEIRATNGRSLCEDDYEIFSASTLVGALEIIQTEAPVAVIVDHNLFGETVYRGLQLLRQAMSDRMIILYSMKSNDRLRENALKAGATLVIAHQDVSCRNELLMKALCPS